MRTRRRPPVLPPCDGCGSTEDTAIMHLAAGGSYVICAGCHERGRRGWFRRDTKADRALERVEA